MKLLVGLGNPGREYENTRHNAGFCVLEKIVEKEDGQWGSEAKANALIYRMKIGSEEVILALPQSYMNLSGEVVSDLLRWFKLSNDDLIIVHDELDLPFGTIQVKKGIGPAGHNGIKSIIQKLGTQDFIRVRIGIGETEKNIPSEKFVLEKFTDSEQKTLDKVYESAREKIYGIVKYGYSEFISKHNSGNSRLEPNSGNSKLVD